MKKLLPLCVLCICVFSSFSPKKFYNLPDDKTFSLFAGSESVAVRNWVDSLYSKIRLDSLGLDRKVFFAACKGFEYLMAEGKLIKPILTICDYSQSSRSKRLYVIDMLNGTVLFNTFVSHGKNSGGEFATSFSNINNSNKSSLGVMVTGETYKSGKTGFSMRLDGVERGINSNVRNRGIVMHGSWYVNEERAEEAAGMGRSQGCPAVPFAERDAIIAKIKEGSCFFAYYPDAWYAFNSQIMKANFNWPSVMELQKNNLAQQAIRR